MSCSKTMACCELRTKLLVSTSNIDIVEEFLKAVKATVLKQISFGDIIKAGETRPCQANSSACWLRALPECPFTLMRVRVILRTLNHSTIRFQIGCIGLLYFCADSILCLTL